MTLRKGKCKQTKEQCGSQPTSQYHERNDDWLWPVTEIKQ